MVLRRGIGGQCRGADSSRRLEGDAVQDVMEVVIGVLTDFLGAGGGVVIERFVRA